MKVYHVTSMKKLLKYKSEGVIMSIGPKLVIIPDQLNYYCNKTDIQEYSGAV